MSNIQPSFVLLILLWPSLELCLETLLFSSALNFNWINPLTQLSYDVLLLHKSFICWNGWHFAESGHLQVDTGHWNMMSYSVFLRYLSTYFHALWCKAPPFLGCLTHAFPATLPASGFQLALLMAGCRHRGLSWTCSCYVNIMYWFAVHMIFSIIICPRKS